MICVDANYTYRQDHVVALDRAIEEEHFPLGCEVLRQLKENGTVASEGGFPICQDTGYAVVFIRLGQDVRLVGGSLADAVDQACEADTATEI